MFSPKPTLLLYVLRNQIILYDARGNAEQFDIPANVTENMEVLDSEKYRQAFTEYLKGTHLDKHRVILLLSDGIVFRKAIAAKDRSTLQSDMESFTAMVPLDNGKQRVIAYEKQGNLLLFGTNSDLYQTLAEILTETGSKVLACIPAAAYNLLANQKPDQTLHAYFFSKFKANRSPDFLAIR